MQKGKLFDMLARVAPMQGVDYKKMPNVMEELAMKCNRCGAWICSKCASKSALGAAAGMIRHSNCGGMFENP
jgi:hypothetical protein